MQRIFKVAALLILLLALLGPDGFAQVKKKRYHSKRDSLRATILSRDSLMRTFRKSDTSINALLKKIEDYDSTYNDIKANLNRGFDTTSITTQLPAFERRVVTIKKLIDNNKSGTLRYLYTIRDFLTHSDDQLDTWQSQLKDINDKLLQNQTDLGALYKDSSLKVVPSDTALRSKYLAQKNSLETQWKQLDSIDKKLFLKVAKLQDRVTTVYIGILDETDEVNTKIRDFSARAFSLE